MRADGSQQHQLTDGPELDERPQVSPDGRFVLFTRRPAPAEARDLYVVSLVGGAPVQLTNSPEDDFEPSFAPNGRTIVFVRGLPGPGGGEFAGNADLFSIRPSGEGLTRLTHTLRDELRPRYFARGIVLPAPERDPQLALPLLDAPRRQRRQATGQAEEQLARRRRLSGRAPAVVQQQRHLEEEVAAVRELVPRPSPLLGRQRKPRLLGRQPRVAGTFTNTSSEVSPFHVLFSVDVSTGLGQGAIESWEPEEGSRQTAIGPVLGW